MNPVDAKDFDDAISFKKIKNGLYEIGVHIADVESLCRDRERCSMKMPMKGQHRCIFPTGCCRCCRSIYQMCYAHYDPEDKLTFSAIFQITAKGEVKSSWLGRTVIHSDHRFTYESAQEVIENREELMRKRSFC